MQLNYWQIKGDFIVTDACTGGYDLHLPTMRNSPKTLEGVVSCLGQKNWTNQELIIELKFVVENLATQTG